MVIPYPTRIFMDNCDAECHELHNIGTPYVWSSHHAGLLEDAKIFDLFPDANVCLCAKLHAVASQRETWWGFYHETKLSSPLIMYRLSSEIFLSAWIDTTEGFHVMQRESTGKII